MNVCQAIKLPLFPAPEEGETVYSVCARFHRRSGYRRPEFSSSLMLGQPHGGRRSDLVIGLQHLQTASSNRIDATESTLRTRTVLGAYLPFMNASRRRAVVDTVLSSDPSTSRAAAGLPWSGVVLRHDLRCCSQCTYEDRGRHGFPYWKVDHQFPGVWMCCVHHLPLLVQSRRGVRNSNWITVDDAKLIESLPHATPQILRQLESVASAICWLASQSVLNVDVLSSMTRLRLRCQQAISCELKCTRAELVRIHEERVRELADTVDQFRAFHNWTWLRHTLFDRRYAHPLRWGLALAISGSTQSSDLSKDYFEALEREPQQPLFSEFPEPLRALAPKALYEALTGPVSIMQAARISGLREGEIERWLRKDASLASAWKTSGYSVKKRAAIMMLEGELLAHESATRTTILRNAPWAFRWLEKNERPLLDSLVPPPYGRRVQTLLWS
jgi:hypothetical protein